MFETYRDEAGEWRWRLTSANGEKVAQATQSYRDKTDAERAVDDVIAAVFNSLHEGLTVFEGENENGEEPLPEEA